MSSSQLIELLSIFFIGIFFAIFPSKITALIFQSMADTFMKYAFQLPYSRLHEAEADRVGLMLASRVFDFKFSTYFRNHFDFVQTKI